MSPKTALQDRRADLAVDPPAEEPRSREMSRTSRDQRDVDGPTVHCELRLVDEPVDEREEPGAPRLERASQWPQKVPIPDPLVLKREMGSTSQQIALESIGDVVSVTLNQRGEVR